MSSKNARKVTREELDRIGRMVPPATASAEHAKSARRERDSRDRALEDFRDDDRVVMKKEQKELERIHQALGTLAVRAAHDNQRLRDALNRLGAPYLAQNGDEKKRSEEPEPDTALAALWATIASLSEDADALAYSIDRLERVV